VVHPIRPMTVIDNSLASISFVSGRSGATGITMIIASVITASLVSVTVLSKSENVVG